VKRFVAIVYGESGSGKTPFAGTLQDYPPTSPCLFLDVDRGAMSLDSQDPKPTVLTVRDFNLIGGVYVLLAAKKWAELAELLTKLRGVQTPVLTYRSVVIDSGTELSARLLTSVVADMEAPTQPEYYKTQARFLKMYEAFVDLEDISVVMTAGVRELKDDVAGIVRHYPDFQPNLSKELIRLTDLIAFMNVALEGTTERKWQRLLYTSLSQRAVARDRSGKLDNVLRAEKFYWKDILPKIGVVL